MAELLILEFEGVGEAEYMRVNEALGIDTSTDEGDWPPGIIGHMAAPTSDGWIVVELWETREDQDEFMKTRLGPALQQGGITKPPKRVEWSTGAAIRAPHRPSAKRQ